MTKFTKIAAIAVFAFAFAFATSAAVTVPPNLMQGSSGTQVMNLQTALGIGADGAFGPITKSAVMSYQAGHGLTADGIVGPMTASSINGSAMVGSLPAGCTSSVGFSPTTGMSCSTVTTLPAGCTSSVGFSTTTGMSCSGGSTPSTGGPLIGAAGSITVTLSSEFSGEEVGEGEEDVEVLAFDVEADDDSDVSITSVKVEFSQNNGADSDDFDDYAESVSVWFDGVMVGSADADDFNESSNVYSKSISLSNAIIRAGDEERLTIAVTALGNLDSGDIDTDQWNVGVSSIRFLDGDGVTTTDSFTLDVTNGAADDAIEKLFDFEDFAGATDVELKAALNDDDESINDAHVLDVDDTDDTTHEILSFTLEARGDSDIWVDEIPFVITTTGETDEAVIITKAILWNGSEKLGTETVPTGGVVVFDDLDMTIDAGDTAEFILEVELQDTNGALDDGDTVQATLTIANVDAEDEAGDSLSAGDLTGAAVGDTHEVRTAGMMATFVSATAVSTPSGVATVDDTGTFKIVFDVTAFDSDVFIDASPIVDETGVIGVGAAGYQNIDASTTSVASGVIECSGCNSTANTTLEVKEDTTERFTVTIAGSGADVFASASLTSIMYSLTAIDGALLYTFDMGDYKTDSVWLDSN